MLHRQPFAQIDDETTGSLHPPRNPYCRSGIIPWRVRGTPLPGRFQRRDVFFFEMCCALTFLASKDDPAGRIGMYVELRPTQPEKRLIVIINADLHRVSRLIAA